MMRSDATSLVARVGFHESESEAGRGQEGPLGRACRHCGTALRVGEAGPFCCAACRAVYGLLHAEGLERYYALGGRDSGQPVAETRAERRDDKWVEAATASLRSAAGLGRVELDVQGLHCSGCVWLIETLARRQDKRARALVNPTLGRVSLFAPSDFDLGRFVAGVERFGYLFGPPRKGEAAPSGGGGLVWRMGVCAAIAMNSMLIAVSMYGGLREGPLYELLSLVNLGLSALSVAVGGSVFFRSAWEGLRRGVLHLDLPIALGIALAFAGSALSQMRRNGEGVYVDTLNVFIALMLAGRWLQERVLAKNRLALLADGGADGLLARRRAAGGGAEVVRCAALGAGDRLVVAPGDLVPVAGELLDRPASFSLDWINGESAPRLYAPGETVPAGAFLAGGRPAELRAATDFAASPLVELLRSPAARDPDGPRSAPWWQRLSRAYVAAVLAAAAAGFAGWMLATGDVTKALGVTTAVLVVTCPCAFGIAVPLASDLALAGLRRAGLFVRAPGFLERALTVRQVVFDKTGTLSTGALALRDPAALGALDPAALAALSTMVRRSSHPKSVAIARALREAGLEGPDLEGAEVEEEPGRGVRLRRGGAEYRLGRPDWASPGAPPRGDVAFAAPGRPAVGLETDEPLRPDAGEEVARLAGDGYEVYLLSGDSPDRARAAALACGIGPGRAFGGLSPEGKAAWAAARDRRDLLMIGDGINDSLAVGAAHCSGTPAVDRPFLAARSDFYFVTAGLRPVRLALSAARAVARVRRRNLALAVAYNVAAVALAYAGLMSPLLCAVFMPASSLTTVLATALGLSPRSPLWKS
ncbi:MAG TPA: heavy metal translocating P-type ATPase metal-binding domain-containing protein [Polyangiaceae bacterium]|nr:heavy metal translocating P-type ATPase metal-binding domain-containing protein [Polyangiaceae bacterium]